MEININTVPNEACKIPKEVDKEPIEIEDSLKYVKEKVVTPVPSAKNEVVPKIQGEIKTLLKEYKISKWDEVEVFYGLIEKWIGSMVKDSTVSMSRDLILLDSHHAVVKSNLHKYLKAAGEDKQPTEYKATPQEKCQGELLMCLIESFPVSIIDRIHSLTGAMNVQFKALSLTKWMDLEDEEREKQGKKLIDDTHKEFLTYITDLHENLLKLWEEDKKKGKDV